MSERLNRVAEAIKKEAADILQRELKDPRIGFVTVTRVKITADLQQATIYYSLLETQGGPATAASTEAGLKSAQGFIRRALGERLRLRVTPEVSFRLDPSVAESIRISKLFSDIHKSESEINE